MFVCSVAVVMYLLQIIFLCHRNEPHVRAFVYSPSEIIFYVVDWILTFLEACYNTLIFIINTKVY
jgi:hypothetical protein